MAEINICAIKNMDGPSLPCRIYAAIVREELRDGISVPKLKIAFQNDQVTIWPADKHRIEQLISDLQRCILTM
jgi:hypothetical protein